MTSVMTPRPSAASRTGVHPFASAGGGAATSVAPCTRESFCVAAPSGIGALVATTVLPASSIFAGICAASSAATKGLASTSHDTASAPRRMSVVTVGWIATTSLTTMPFAAGTAYTPGVSSGGAAVAPFGMRSSDAVWPLFAI